MSGEMKPPSLLREAAERIRELEAENARLKAEQDIIGVECPNCERFYESRHDETDEANGCPWCRLQRERDTTVRLMSELYDASSDIPGDDEKWTRFFNAKAAVDKFLRKLKEDK